MTSPFAALTHFARYHHCGSFSRYSYAYHLTQRGFRIEELTPSGDRFAYSEQKLMRPGSMVRGYGDWSWPFAYALGVLRARYFKGQGSARPDNLACFGWQRGAVKRTA